MLPVLVVVEIDEVVVRVVRVEVRLVLSFQDLILTAASMKSESRLLVTL